MKYKGKCLNPHCKREKKHRGLCQSCYQQARLLVVSNATSWEKLERDGKCEACRPHAPYKESRSWFLSVVKKPKRVK